MNETLRHATADEAGILAAGAENVAVNGLNGRLAPKRSAF